MLFRSAASGDVTALAHGMTVATNALLEGAVARTALVATEAECARAAAILEEVL